MKRLSVWISLAAMCSPIASGSTAQPVEGSAEPQSPSVILSQDDLLRASRECIELAALSNQAETRENFQKRWQLTNSIRANLGPVVKITSGIKGRCVVIPGARACEIAPSIYIQFARPGPRFFEADKLDFEFTGPAKVSDNNFLHFTGSAMFCSITFHPTSPRFTQVK